MREMNEMTWMRIRGWLSINRKLLPIRTIPSGTSLDIRRWSTRIILTRRVRVSRHVLRIECILRVWEIENGEHKVCINMDINIQELEYVVHLEPEGVPSLDDYSKIFNRIMAVCIKDYTVHSSRHRLFHSMLSFSEWRMVILLHTSCARSYAKRRF